jgi:carboxymethylenebutenolidase
MANREDPQASVSRRQFIKSVGTSMVTAGVMGAGSLSAEAGEPRIGGEADSGGGRAPGTVKSALHDDKLQHEQVEYKSGSDTVRAFLCRPKAAGKYPAVIVIHEIFGLTDHIRDVSCRLAQAGYVALAPDLYTREGGAPETMDFTKLREFVGKIADTRIVGDLKAGMAYLRTRPDVRGDRIGSVGFCMGGLYSMLLAGNAPDLKAAVAYSGRLVYPEKTAEKPTAPIDVVPEIKAAIQGHYGGADQAIPVETVEKFRAALIERGKTPEIYIYDDAPHAFHNDTRPSYRPEAAKLAWSRTLAWFDKHLKG